MLLENFYKWVLNHSWVCNPSTQKAEAGGSGDQGYGKDALLVQSQSGLYETLFEKQTKKKTKNSSKDRYFFKGIGLILLFCEELLFKSVFGNIVILVSWGWKMRDCFLNQGPERQDGSSFRGRQFDSECIWILDMEFSHIC